jgi:lipopolysaccharide transport system ATP-binding protein
MLLETERRRSVAAGSHAEASGETQHAVHRQGSMELEIVDIQFQDTDGTPIAKISAGDALVAVISCTSRREILSPIFSLAISDAGGKKVLDSNTSQMDMPCIEHKAIVRVCIEHLDLPGGEYFVDLGAYEKDWACIYDYHWHMHPLSVTDEQQISKPRNQPIWELLPAEARNNDSQT